MSTHRSPNPAVTAAILIVCIPIIVLCAWLLANVILMTSRLLNLIGAV
jgi:hypothetical protein